MFNGFFKFGRGAGIVYPPVSEDLLVLFRGDDDGIKLKLDSWLNPDAENWAMSGAYCAALNGTDEFGTFSIPKLIDNVSFSFILDSQTVQRLFYSGTGWYGDDMFIITYEGGGSNRVYLRINAEGTSTQLECTTAFGVGDILNISAQLRSDGKYDFTVNGEILVTAIPLAISSTDLMRFGAERGASSELACGRVFDITVNDKHFRIAEGSGLTSYSDDYLTDGLSIAWTAAPVTLWAQRQDTYFGNALAPGWWEIYGDDVLYPYPVTGFDEHHEGGTFNDCEVSSEPESKTPGTMNGTDTEIVFDNAVPVGATMTFGGTATAVLDVGNSKITDAVGGTIRNIQIMDGAEVWAYLAVDEGTGLIFADSSGNDNGARTTDDPVAFWAGAPMVSQAVGDAEAAADVPYFTDGNYHPVAKNQQEWENDLNDDWQRYFCPKVGMWFYKTKRDEAGHLENVEFMYKQCDQLYEALYDEVSGEIVYDEVSLKILYDEET